MPRRRSAAGGATASFSGEAAAAWAIWACATAAAIVFVAVYALRFPFGDEWEWVGRATGDEPVTLAWLWSQHNEHRMFLPRLIYLGLGALTGFDFRAGAFFNVLVLSGLAGAMMISARRLRGETKVYDAFFALLFLHWAQAENLIWGFQLNFVTAVFMEGLILLVILRCKGGMSLKSFVFAAACFVLLGLCGTYGVVFLPPLACWLLYVAIRRWRSGDCLAKRDAALMFLAALVPAAFTALYLRGLQAGVATEGVYATLRTAVEFLSFGIGPAAKETWPVSGLMILVVCAVAAGACLVVFRKQPAERVRVAGFFMFFAGIALLALAIGLGRSYIGPMAGFEVRYMTLAAPLVALVFFVSELYGGPALRRYVPRTLFVLMCVLFLVNAQKGVSYSQNLWGRLWQFEQDMRDGVSPQTLGARYADQWGYGRREIFTTRLAWLEKARLGPYRIRGPKADKAPLAETIGAKKTNGPSS